MPQTEAVVIPIIVDPKKGVAGLKDLEVQAKSTTATLEDGAGKSDKFGGSLAKLGSSVLKVAGVMKLADFAAKVLVGKFVELFDGTNKMVSAQNLLNASYEEAVTATKKDVTQLNVWLAVAQNTNASYAARQNAIDKLNATYPQLHKNLTIENVLTKEVAASIQSVIDALVRRSQVDILIKQISELNVAISAANANADKLGSGTVKNQFLKFAREAQSEVDTLTQRVIELQQQLFNDDGRDSKGAKGALLGADTKAALDKGKQELAKSKADFEKYAREQIALANKYSSAFGSSISLQLGIGFFDTFKEQFDKSVKYLKDFKAGNFKYNFKSDVSIVPPEQGTAEGLEFGQFFKKELDAYFNQTEPVDLSLVNAPEQWDEYISKLEEMREKQRLLAAEVTGVLAPAFSTFIDSIVNKQNAFDAFFNSIKSGIISLTKRIVEAIAQAAILSLITGGAGRGGVGFTKALGGILGFAEGGVVFGPTLAAIGEGPGTNRSNPEVVAPLDKLTSILTNVIGGRGFNASNVGNAGAVFTAPQYVQLYGDGRSLSGVIKLENQSQNITG